MSTTTEQGFRLYENPGWGSAIVEAQLALYGLRFTLVPGGDIFASPAARAALAPVNPLMQSPTLLLPSGEVMTESAAMTLYLADVAGTEMMVPGPRAPERAAFLRWLVYIVANIYPAGAFFDAAERYLDAPEPVAEFRDKVLERRRDLWRLLAAEVAKRGGPWFLGARFSALDLYVAVMTHWRPGRDWFARETPGLLRIAEAVAARPDLAAVFARNFPK